MLLMDYSGRFDPRSGMGGIGAGQEPVLFLPAAPLADLIRQGGGGGGRATGGPRCRIDRQEVAR